MHGSKKSYGPSVSHDRSFKIGYNGSKNDSKPYTLAITTRFEAQ